MNESFLKKPPFTIAEESSPSYAFKDWRIVVEALGQGKQCLLFRKGGIQEKEFQLKAPTFWLLPTSYHEDLLQIKPQYRTFLAGEVGGQDRVVLKYIATVYHSLFITDWEKVRCLSAFHVWEEEILKKRFEYGKKRGLSLLIVRVYKTRSPFTIAWDEKAMGGCRSWIKMTIPSENIEKEAVMDEEKFCEMQKSILFRINGV
ncbi:hypothetical protein A7Q09_04310 [Methylacidiphilum sp. Yel]|uniref:DUF1802 family protein n=1 Tax=Methylacidiphilum sp. Yel TaxID=1847730 RepID=UPI00106A12A6|nr:DUF1802 family protein [Methylacidiphilum sp. Yel]TFE70274.1 hypothetical protein A7Q09_04310 [Methylacidiphilum sp. Yel]